MSGRPGAMQSPVMAVIPAGACDCHAHVFGALARYPFDAARVYTPGEAARADLDVLHRQLGIDRVVLVHPSPYGTDNRIGIDTLAAWGPARARGVCVIGPQTSAAELRALDAAGMRGARANLATTSVGDPAAAWSALEALAERIAPLGWHLQTYTSADVIAALGERLMTLPVPLVIDHFGGLDAARGPGQPGFDVLRRLIGSGRAYVKLSAAYRSSALPDAVDLAPIARALLAENPERCVWGTDWPHPGGRKRTAAERDTIEPFLTVDDGAALNRLATWCASPPTLARVLVDNPAHLYGFA